QVRNATLMDRASYAKRESASCRQCRRSLSLRHPSGSEPTLHSLRILSLRSRDVLWSPAQQKAEVVEQRKTGMDIEGPSPFSEKVGRQAGCAIGCNRRRRGSLTWVATNVRAAPASIETMSPRVSRIGQAAPGTCATSAG